MKLWLPRIQIALLSAFCFFLPTQLGKHFFFDFSYINGIRIDYLAPTLHVTDILAVLLMVMYAKPVLAFFRQRSILILAAICAVTVLLSQSPLLGLYRILKGAEWLAIFAIFAHLRTNRQLILGMMIAFLVGTALELTNALLQLSYKHSMQGIFYWLGERRLSLTTPDVAIATLGGPYFLRPYGTFSHPNSLGGFYLLLYFAVMVVPWFRTFPRLRSITMFISMLLVFLSFSKTAIAVFVLLNLFIFVEVALKGKCRFCGISRVLVLLALGLTFGFTHGDVNTIDKRILLIDNAFDMILKHPIFGVGVGNYLVEQSKYVNNYSSFFLQPVHNIVLLFLAETGVVGGLAILAVFYQKFLVMITHRSFQFCFGVVLLTGMMDHYWLTLQQNFLLTAVVFGLLSGIYSQKKVVGATNVTLATPV